MTDVEWQEATLALTIWTGWGHASFPLNQDELVVKHFGKDAAARLLPLVKELSRDYSSSESWIHAADGLEMVATATAEFKARHPNAPEKAIKVLAWCYSYDHK